MADESKITLKMGIIASAVSALIMLVGGAIWNQQSRLVILETNYGHLCTSLTKMENILEQIRDTQTGKDTQNYYDKKGNK
jgi:nitrate/TMAO reductase-like tetraheme cytochrome c subunit